jgi:hypothetical protein
MHGMIHTHTHTHTLIYQQQPHKNTHTHTHTQLETAMTATSNICLHPYSTQTISDSRGFPATAPPSSAEPYLRVPSMPSDSLRRTRSRSLTPEVILRVPSIPPESFIRAPSACADKSALRASSSELSDDLALEKPALDAAPVYGEGAFDVGSTPRFPTATPMEGCLRIPSERTDTTTSETATDAPQSPANSFCPRVQSLNSDSFNDNTAVPAAGLFPGV